VVAIPASEAGNPGGVALKRWGLGQRDPTVVAEALADLRSLVRAGRNPSKKWFVLEGLSRPDALLETEHLAVCIEGKRTEKSCTTTTEFMTCRSQLLRHMDAAMQAFPGKRILGLLIVEGDGGGPGAVEASEYWRKQSEAQYAAAMVRDSLPHRTASERQALSDGILGVTTWQAVCAEFRIPWPPSP
jgi:hypothetical protein